MARDNRPFIWWQDQAACGEFRHIFDQLTTTPYPREARKQAEEICANCPVFDECEEDVKKRFIEKGFVEPVFAAGRTACQWRREFKVKAGSNAYTPDILKESA